MKRKPVLFLYFISFLRRYFIRILTQRSYKANGQAMVEYILLMVVVLVVIGALLRGFNTGTANYLQDVFGGGQDEYLGCLLRKGQLPQLGLGQTRESCVFPAFDFKAADVPEFAAPPQFGDPPQFGSPPSFPPDQIIGPGPNFPNAPNIQPAPRIQPVQIDPVKGNIAGKGTRESRQGIIPIQNTSSTDGGLKTLFGQQKASGRTAKIPVNQLGTEGNASFSGNGQNSLNNIRSGNQRGSGFIRLSDRAKNKFKAAQFIRRSPASEGPGGGVSKRNLIPIETQKAQPPFEDEGWNFAFLFKYLIIAAILIVILLLLAGQFVQIKKGLQGT